MSKKRNRNSSGFKKNIFLLSLLLVVIIIGTIIFINNFILLKSDNHLTTAATDSDTGISNLTITAVTSLSSSILSIEFGSGFINGSCTKCVMDSNGQHNQTGACCLGFKNVSSGFLLENTGNLNVSVSYNCSGHCNASGFINGTDPHFEIKVTNNYAANQSGELGAADTSASCIAYNDGSSAVVFNGWNLTNVSRTTNPEANYTEVTSLGAWLCGNMTHYPLSFLNTNDATVIDINISIPHDASGGQGTKTATFTFNAYSSG